MSLHLAEKTRHRGQILAASEVTDRSGSCPICHSTAPREAVHQLQQSPPIRFLKCSVCRGVSVSHMPSSATIRSLYERYYVESDREKYTFHGIQRLVHGILKFVHITPDQGPLRILDFGGGDGTLCKEIRNCIQARQGRTSVAASVVELYEGENIADEDLSIRFYKDLGDLEGQFDLVVASAVLHQVPDVHQILRGLFDRVRHGGIFFARTAFVLPLVRLFGSLIDPLYPYHVHDMGCEFWNRVTQTFSLPARIIRSRPSLVELQVRRAPIRALAAHVLKLPANLELSLSRRLDRNPMWKFVGGWEVSLRFD